MKLTSIIVLSSFIPVMVASAQSSRFSIETGAISRVTIFYYTGTGNLTQGSAPNAMAPYAHEKGVNGTGINVAISYNLIPMHGIKIYASTTGRYDFYKFRSSSNVNTIYFDQSAFITKSIRTKYYAGIGFTVYNIGEELHYTNGGRDWTLPLQFNSIDFLIGISVWKIYAEPKISIVQKDFPGKIKDNATLFGLRAYYRFKLEGKGI